MVRANAQDGRLPRRPHPQMPMLHQKIRAVLFRRDGIRRLLINQLHDFQIFNIQLIAARGPLVRTDFAAHDDRAFLRQRLDARENFFRHAGFMRDTLDGAGAIAKNRKDKLAGFAQVVEPSAQGDGLAVVLANRGNRG